MPISRHCAAKYKVWSKFKVGQRLRRTTDGMIFILGRQKNAYACWIMQIDPGKKGIVSWQILLDNFESAE